MEHIILYKIINNKTKRLLTLQSYDIVDHVIAYVKDMVII